MKQFLVAHDKELNSSIESFDSYVKKIRVEKPKKRVIKRWTNALV